VAENKAAIERVDAHNSAQFAALHDKLEEMTGKLNSMAEMFETYTAIKRGGKAVEWLSKVIAACLVIWAFIKGFWQLLIEAGKG
jgi:hypothetical protein